MHAGVFLLGLLVSPLVIIRLERKLPSMPPRRRVPKPTQSLRTFSRAATFGDLMISDPS